MHGGKLVQHLIVAGGLIRMDSRGVLTQVVKTRKCLAAVAREGTLARVFSENRLSDNRVKEGARRTGHGVQDAHYG
jgi:hypothetical protein